MIKKVICVFLIGLVLSCNFEKPVQFSHEALNEKLNTLKGESITLESVLNKYKGQTILIDVWASWCADCIKGMPDVKALQNEFNDVEFVFLSVDRNEAIWKRSIQKYNVRGEHYFVPTGQNGAFGDFLNSNWIPRYMVIDKEGSIKLFKAKRATDSRIKEALK
jgi:thiol-disulfide isomerase/thioredoxin